MPYTGTLVKVGTGASLLVCTTSGGTFVPVGEPIGDMGIKVKSLFEDATNQQSTAKERIAVFSDYPSFPLECNMVVTDPGQLIVETAALAQPPAKLFFKYQKTPMGTQTTTGDLFTFAGFVDSFDMSTPVDKKATAKFNLTISGAITKVVGT